MQPSVPGSRLQELLSSPIHPSISSVFFTFTSPAAGCTALLTNKPQSHTSVRHSQPKVNGLMIFLFMSAKGKIAALVGLVDLTFRHFCIRRKSVRTFTLLHSRREFYLTLYLCSTLVHVVHFILEQHIFLLNRSHHLSLKTALCVFYCCCYC